MNRYMRLLLQFLGVLALYYVLDYFNLISWYLILAIFVLVFVYLYFQARITDHELYFEIMGNVTLYLQRLEKSKDAKLKNDSYYLGLAYAAVYKREFDTAQQHLDNVDFERLPRPERQHHIYIRIQAQLAYQESDLEMLEQLRLQADTLENPKLSGYISVLKELAIEQYKEASMQLKELVPDEKTRLHLMELEYMLAICYMELEEYENASAVFGYVVKQGHGIAISDLAYEKYLEIQDSGLLNNEVIEEESTEEEIKETE